MRDRVRDEFYNKTRDRTCCEIWTDDVHDKFKVEFKINKRHFRVFNIILFNDDHVVDCDNVI